MPTPHISAPDGAFAPHVLMPGDPRRAKLIAETFLDSPVLVTEVRGILGYTGSYEGQPLSVMASGMGIPSISIYATELIRHYGVTRIVRVGTVGGMQPELRLGDVVVASAAHTDSSVSALHVPRVNYSHAPAFSLLRAAAEFGERSGARMHVGAVLTTDSFYNDLEDMRLKLQALGTLAVEMEAAGLYAIADRHRIEALMIGTVSDHLLLKAELTAEERETTFADMVSIAIAAIQH